MMCYTYYFSMQFYNLTSTGITFQLQNVDLILIFEKLKNDLTGHCRYILYFKFCF